MGAPPTDPQRPPDHDRLIQEVEREPDEAGPAQAGSAPAETPGSPPRADTDASDRTARYLMGPTAFCA
jgi:hypothetical protein